MAENSFQQYSASSRSTRWVIITGIAVLVIAAGAAISAGFIAFTDNDETTNASPAAVSPAPLMTGTPPPEMQDISGPPSELSGSFSGVFSSSERQWQGVVSLNEETGVLLYPDSGCQVFLSQGQRDGQESYYAAQGLNSECSPAGAWVFSPASDGEGLEAKYLEGETIAAEAELQKL